MALDIDRKVPPWALAVAAAVAAFMIMFVFEQTMERIDDIEQTHSVDQGHDRTKRGELGDDNFSIHSELEEERVLSAYHRGVADERARWLIAGHNYKE
jgi:hypothetical protein